MYAPFVEPIGPHNLISKFAGRPINCQNIKRSLREINKNVLNFSPDFKISKPKGRFRDQIIVHATN